MVRRRPRARLLVSALALALAGAVLSAPAQSASGAARGPEGPGCHRPVRPASQMRIEDCDSPQRVIEKAAKTVPTKGQYAWQQREVTAFTHFGMNTFTDREWGSGAEDPSLFDPGHIDFDQWMRAYKAAGAEQVMLTAKHHDGFALWPSRYTEHSVENTPYGRDVVGQYVKAARKAGLKVGVYLSPADGAELPHGWHEKWLADLRAKQDAGEQLTTVERTALADGGPPRGKGRYGNGSEPTERTFPTLVPGDDRAEKVASGELPSFTAKVNDYDAYYLNQVYEIVTEYGPLDELWLDGANPWRDAGVTQEYGWSELFRALHELAPDTPVFGGPQGVRWVGNENGVARESEWSVTPSTRDPWTAYAGGLPNDSTDPDIGSREKLLDPSVKYLQWYPAEADVSLRPGWYHHADEHPKSAARLLELYEKSVGRNASLLLNVPPAKNGRIDAADVRELTAFGDAVRDIYGTDLRKRGPGPHTFDRVAVGEDIREGQRVERFTVEARSGGAWREIASGTTIGHRRILELPQPVTARQVRVKVEQSRGKPHLRPLTLHLAEQSERPAHPRAAAVVR
ncbi:alpha-L-fucosidase [Streptomyces diacarni]|uniref:alpha-L-fucosidase n=1 Tax=Streptomyces diacarni TaxID=2800381 RepID=A0A367F728_9ACTN|nr:alpha-L-fucosidase [Streptomyces diacarni]RCG26061.1 alpha-L-fucosidase [Streptomyces diacarni]